MNVYVCPNCNHEGQFWYRHGKVISCVRCEAPLFVRPAEDWAPESTVFWRRPDGTYTLPANRDAKMPAEYERVEAQETHDKRRIVAAIDREEKQKAEQVFVGKQMLHEQVEAANRAELRQAMFHGRVIEDERTGEKRTVGPMRPELQEFARVAMDAGNHTSLRRSIPAFYLRHLEYNDQNCERYTGPDGLSGKRR